MPWKKQSVTVSTGKSASDLDSNRVYHRAALLAQRKVLEFLDGEQPYNDSLDFYFAQICNITLFVASLGPLNQLEALGTDLIRNDIIVTNILEIYDFKYQSLINTHEQYLLHSNVMINEIQPRHFDQFALLSGTMRPLDVIKLKADKNYRYHLTKMMFYNEFLLGSMDRTIQDVIALLAMVEQELIAK